MQPQHALDVTLNKTDIDRATTSNRNMFVDDLTDNGDTLLLAAIRSGDKAQALTLINRLEPPEIPPTMRAKEANALLARYTRRADPFLRGADGMSLWLDDVAVQTGVREVFVHNRRRYGVAQAQWVERVDVDAANAAEALRRLRQ